MVRHTFYGCYSTPERCCCALDWKGCNVYRTAQHLNVVCNMIHLFRSNPHHFVLLCTHFFQLHNLVFQLYIFVSHSTKRWLNELIDFSRIGLLHVCEASSPKKFKQAYRFHTMYEMRLIIILLRYANATIFQLPGSLWMRITHLYGSGFQVICRRGFLCCECDLGMRKNQIHIY